MLANPASTPRPDARGYRPGGFPAAPAVAVRPHTALTLPRLHTSVPGGYTLRKGNAAQALALAHALIDAGVLQERHRRGGVRKHGLNGTEPYSSLESLVSRAIEDFTAAARPDDGHLTELVVHVGLPLDFGDQGYESDYAGTFDLCAKFGGTRAQMGGFSVGYNSSAYIWPVGGALNAMQVAVPGLGRRVLGILTAECWNGLATFAPPDAYGWAQHAYWQGELDESLVEEEYLLEAKDAAAERGEPFDEQAAKSGLDVFRKADIDATIPTWAATKYHSSPPLADRHWRQLLAGRPSALRPDLWALCQQAAQLDAMPKTWQRGENPLYHFSCAGERAGLVISWREKDVCQQIYDEVMHDVFQSGEGEPQTLGVFPFFPNNPASIRWALDKLRTALQRHHALERLVRALADWSKDHPEKPVRTEPRPRRQPRGRPLIETLIES